ncbi:MAG TPA: AAA family ATPase, partial [Thermoanaerobaculia bacterium]|nr:AAA family ATPase [Thermoanaerobaculia bacterium]
MHLTGIDSLRFRSLYDSWFPLKPLTLVIGPNGSGKSNLFKALRFLQVAVVGDASEWRTYDAESDDLVWYGHPGQSRRLNQFRLLSHFGGSGTACAGSAVYETVFDVNDSIEIFEEKLWLRSEGSDRTLLDRRSEETDLPDGSKIHTRSPHALALRDLGDSDHPCIQAVFQHIAGWRFFDVDPHRARRTSYIPEHAPEMPALDASASNLSAFLYALRVKSPGDLEEVIEALQRAIDSFPGLIIDHDGPRGGKHARYRFHEAPFGDRLIPPESMSDGTIRLLAHLALLLADRSVSLACLEEPDAGLHPSLMPHLADALRQAVRLSTSKGLGRQVLVATHNPELMDCFNLAEENEYLQVLVTERTAEGKTLVTPVTAAELAPWLERYRLG